MIAAEIARLKRELEAVEDELGGICGCKQRRIAELQRRRTELFELLRAAGVDPELVSSL